MQKLFSTLEVLGVSELNLSANQWKDDMKRYEWTPQTGTAHLHFPFSVTKCQSCIVCPEGVGKLQLQLREGAGLNYIPTYSVRERCRISTYGFFF